MGFAKGLTPHTVLFLVDKPEKTVSLAPLLTRLKYKLVTAVSLYECLRLIDQEMPHLIVCDAILPDGNAGVLYDRMQQQALYRDIPVLVMIASKTREQLNPLKGRKFAGFLLGKVEPKAMLAKIVEVLESHQDVSPFFIRAEDGCLVVDCTLAAEAKVVGRVGDQMVCQSEAEVDPDASLLCQPQEKGKGPAIIRLGSNVHRSGSIYNLFPLNQAKGSGRTWMSHLPEINLDRITGGQDKRGRVLFYDPKIERFEQFKRVFEGYDIDLIHAPSLQAAAAMMGREADSGVSCIYLDELPSTAAGIAIKDAIQKIPEKFRPPVIVATTALNSRSTREIRYIRKPFGLGILVEALDTAIKSRMNFAEGAGTKLEIHYQTPAKLLGLDETGGILQTKWPLVVGNKLILQHPELVKMWEGSAEVKITSIVRMEPTSNIWQIKFETITAQGSKSKYWEKISRHLSEKAIESAG